MAFVELLHGPYECGPHKTGAPVLCAVHGLQVVGGFWGPRSWPRARVKGRPQLIVCDGLLLALKTETREAVSFHWGVHVQTVANWRRALGLTHVLTEAVVRFRSRVMQENRAAHPETFLFPGIAHLQALSNEARRNLGLATAGERRWSQEDLALLQHGEVRQLALRLGRTPHSVRSARSRVMRLANLTKDSRMC